LLITFYISGHGFGHASRSIELIDAIAARRADVRFDIRTAAAPRLFERARADVRVQPTETDTGVVQIDGLHLDEDKTVMRAAAFYSTFDERVNTEAARLRTTGARLVVGDIPPLAFAAADRAGLPSVAVGNFTWDWIYERYDGFAAIAPNVNPAIRRAYAKATKALRLPFHGGFEPMSAATTDIPLIARRSRRNRDEIRRLLEAPPDRPLVLASFGAYGASLPYDAIAGSSTFTLIAGDEHVGHALDYEDLVAAADVVVSKPGYGIVSECIANGAALLYASRGRFAEYDLFVAAMPRVLRCREISHEDLFAGRWSEHVAALVAQPAPPERWRTDGAAIAADELLEAARG
jgi:UDP:flavonoid glycosyltransferase YjiC (YdhE family)